MQRISLPYSNDSSALFQHLLELPFPAFLDSGLQSQHRGRYDILTAQPDFRIEADKNGARVFDQQAAIIDQSPDAFTLLKRWLEQTGFDQQQDTDLPFNGGALGYFSYDLGRSLEAIPTQAKDDIDLPWLRMGIYRWAIIVDHQQASTALYYPPEDPPWFYQQLAKTIQTATAKTDNRFCLSSSFVANLDLEGYLNKFRQVIEYIHSGDCYQVNLAQRFSADYSGHPWQAYQALKAVAPTPFSAYLGSDLGSNQGTVLSFSPERFIQVKQCQVETRPIKGTRPRGKTQAEDQHFRDALLHSEKDRAENLMIVDLLRNDMSKTCVTGSVKTEQLFALESYPNVHHLVSVIKGQLAHPLDAIELLKGCFPGGSITGAPKIRAMEVIEELEPHRRSVYCGAIGYIAFNGNVDTNISIRTLVAHQGKLHCWAGGGVVADSEGEAEYQETLDKVSNLLNCLEQQFLQTD